MSVTNNYFNNLRMIFLINWSKLFRNKLKHQQIILKCTESTLQLLITIFGFQIMNRNSYFLFFI